MNFLLNIYHVVLYTPLFNALIFIYNVLPWDSIGLAIIILTIIIRLILFPFSKKSIESQRALQKLQPEMSRLREEFKDDKEKQSQALMKLYSENKVSPLSSCLPLLVQLPIIFAIYRVFEHGLRSSDSLSVLYPFVANPGAINTVFLGIIDLAQPKNVVLAVIAGGLQFIQSWMMMQKNKQPKKDPNKKRTPQEEMADTTQNLSRNMMYFFPLITIWFGYTLPAGLSLYWVVTTLFAILQQWLLQRKDKDEESHEHKPEEAPKTV